VWKPGLLTLPGEGQMNLLQRLPDSGAGLPISNPHPSCIERFKAQSSALAARGRPNSRKAGQTRHPIAARGAGRGCTQHSEEGQPERDQSNRLPRSPEAHRIGLPHFTTRMEAARECMDHDQCLTSSLLLAWPAPGECVTGPEQLRGSDWHWSRLPSRPPHASKWP
jgi:hypothetical protein